MIPRDLEVHIDELVLEGVPAPDGGTWDAGTLGEAVRRALAERMTGRAVAPRTPRSQTEALAGSVAEAIEKGLGR